MIKFLMVFLLTAGWSGICNASGIIMPAIVSDTLPAKKMAEQKPMKQNKKGPEKIIKEVPRAKNQSAPKAIVVKPVKVKPVKVIKPRINGKGFGK
jgi:hypothetical protein